MDDSDDTSEDGDTRVQEDDNGKSRRRRDRGIKFIPLLSNPVSNEISAAGLTRDQWSTICFTFVIVLGGSKFAYWCIGKYLEFSCIAFDLDCKPEGY
jgi:hypothetical protein